MNKKMISQELYDNLCLSLARNAKALKGDVGFITIKKRLERNAHISFEGVEVETIYLEMAQETLTRIVNVNGKKYDTTLDKIVLLDLAEALAVPAPSSDQQEVITNSISPAISPMPSVTTGPPSPDAPLHSSDMGETCQVAAAPKAGDFTGRPDKEMEKYTIRYRWISNGRGGLIEHATTYWKAPPPIKQNSFAQLTQMII